jgi:two-component sensor histidine kinase
MPLPLRYLIALATVLATFGLLMLLDRNLRGYPYLLFFVPIILNSVVIDRGTGIFSTVVSAFLAWQFLIGPEAGYGFEVNDAVGVAMFLGVGIFIAGLTEALRATAEDLVESNLRLRSSEQENRLLLAEINHRFKNSLATMSALLRRQGAEFEGLARPAFNAAADRLVVLSRVHDRLQLDKDGPAVEGRDFLRQLCEDLQVSLIGLRPVVLRVASCDCSLKPGRAVAVGLLVNELVTNAVKHAFPDDRAGTIQIGLDRGRDHFTLSVADDGIGMPLAGPGRSGTLLVRALVQQLDGALDREGPPGLRIRVRFPVDDPG